MANGERWEQVPEHELTEDQREFKRRLDAGYEEAVKGAYAGYRGKSGRQKESARARKRELYDEYLRQARQHGLYRQVSPQQRIAELEAQKAAIEQELEDLRRG